MYDNTPLRNLLANNYIKKPIATKEEENEPRLLVVSVDIKEGATVTFDSYVSTAKKCDICKKDCKDNKKLIEHINSEHIEKDDKVTSDLRWSVYGNIENKHAIFYDEGVTLDQVMASAAVPLYFDYKTIEGYDYKLITSKQDKIKPSIKYSRSKSTYHFWDGQLLSNTPLRELISKHKTFWEGYLESKGVNLEAALYNHNNHAKNGDDNSKEVPDLEVYIANLWPTREDNLPQDIDLAKDRKHDLIYHDKTLYDEKVAQFVTDYIDLSRKLIKLAADKGAKDEIEDILGELAESSFRDNEKRQYKDLLVGRFALRKVIRIERKDDPDAISLKWGDYSSGTISILMKEGINDALNTLVKDVKKSEGIEFASGQIDTLINEIKKQNIEHQNANLIEAAEDTRARFDRL